jgi:ribonuclease P protein component
MTVPKEPQTDPVRSAESPESQSNAASSAVRLKYPKAARMPAGVAYSKAFKGRRVVSDATISVHVAPNGLPIHRLGLAVAKKMFRKAVARNRIKRIIREAFRHERPRWSGGLDIVVRPKVKDLTYAGLRESLRFLVPKAERKFGPLASPLDPPRPEPPAGPEP